MHTRLSPENPHGYTRYGFAWEYVPANQNAHLDFGCYQGKFLNTLKAKNIDRLVGVDISRQAVETSRELHPNLEIIHITQSVPLPFTEETFGSITILDVLEHITGQAELLTELNRVLRQDGKLIVTLPGQHLFSFLDLGNLKFRFPRLHRWYYCLSHSREDYEYRYVSNPDGLIGDISADKAWHEHFKRKKLKAMLEQCGFSVTVFDGSGFFSRLIINSRRLLRWARPIDALLDKIYRLDAKVFESTNLFCLAIKTDVIRQNQENKT